MAQARTLELFHGSTKIIQKPILGQGNRRNDYGLGFYCTPNEQMAGEWACSNGADGFINAYNLNTHGLKILNLNSPDYTILHWLTVLIQNRTFSLSGDAASLAAEYLANSFSVPVQEYDVVRGYRADDSYFAFASAFLNGTISLPTLQKAMHLGKLGEQIVPRTQKAFDQLEFTDARPAAANYFLPRFQARDQKARQDFQRMKNQPSVLSEPRMIDILREQWQPNDPRLKP
ncbi:MAG: DUF3990 domain-containing protein [Coriobacteriia bacterium]|nr:DUF3990 domain-containing protein [Coriobacteriia bacterium]